LKSPVCLVSGYEIERSRRFFVRFFHASIHTSDFLTQA